MSKKLLSRLLSFTMSATVALTSGVPALAYDGGGGDLLEVEDEEIQLLDEEEVESDFDVPEEEVLLEEEQESEEFFASEDEAEFETMADVKYQIDGTTHTLYGAYTVNGDTATVCAYVTDISIDSVNGAEVYIVPKTNYEIADADLAAAIKVIGSYSANDADKAAAASDVTKKVSIPTSAYTITKSTKTSVSGADGFDIGSAYVVRILGNTDWLKAYKTALYNDGLGGAITTDSTVVDSLKIQIDNSKFSIKKFPLEVTGEDTGLEIATQYAQYDQDNTTPLVDVSSAVSTANWLKKKVSVKLVKAGKDDIKFLENTLSNEDDTTSGKEMNSTSVCVFHVDNAHKVYISPKGVSEAISKIADGWTLQVAITDSSSEITSGITLLSESESYFTIKGLSEKPTATNDDPTTTDKYTAIITSKATTTQKAWGDVWYPIKVTTTETNRVLTDVKYSVNGGTYKSALPLDYSAHLAAIDASTWVEFDGDTTTTDPTFVHDAGYYVIPKAELAAISEAATISIKTESKELVTLKLSRDGNGKSLVGFSDAALVALTSTITAGDNINASVASSVETGKKYSFSVVPSNGYMLSAVSATMYNADGTGGARLVLEEGDYGKYTSKTVVTGPVELTITTTEQPIGKWNVLVADDTVDPSNASVAHGAIVKELKTGSVAGVLEADGDIRGAAIKASDGKPFAFTVKGGAGYTIKKVEYTMGATVTEAKALTATKVGLDGTFYYQIDDVDGNVLLTITDEDARNIIKVANEDAIITSSDQELADNAAAVVNQRENFKFKVAGLNGATVDAVYYKVQNATPVTSIDTAGTKLIGNASGEYEIGYGVIASAGANILITAVTSRAIPAADYSVKFEREITSDPTYATIEKLELCAGGNYATATTLGTDELTKATVKATVKSSKGATITGTSKWIPGKTIATERIVDFNNDAIDGPVISSTKISSTDTLTYKLTNGFPNGVSYTATLPVTTVKMSSYYDKIELKPTVTLSAGGYTGVTRATLEGANTIRVKVPDPAAPGTPIINDSMDLDIYGYMYNEDGTTKSTYHVTSTDTTAAHNIKSIAWSTTPERDATLNPQPYSFTPCGCKHNVVIANALKPMSFTVTALITFADDSTASVSAPVTISEETYGYVAVPTVTINGIEAAYAASYALALNSTTTKSATITWRVFEKLIPGALTASWNQTEAGIKEEIRLGNIKEVPASDVAFSDAKSDDTTGTYATVTGSDSVTVTAKKKAASVVVSPVATVNGLPVGISGYSGAVRFAIANDATTYNVAVVTNDQTGEGITEYKNPQMTSGALASVTPMSKKATTGSIGTAKEIYEEYDLTAVPYGTELTLPDQSAFDATTVNPKKALIGWNVNGKYYKADGTQKVVITAPTTITAIWAYKYKAGAVGYVQLFSEIGSGTEKTYTALTPATSDGTSSLSVASGKSVQVKVGYQALDIAAGPDPSGNPQYDKEWTYTSTGLAFTCEADPTNYSGVIAAPSNGLITSKASSGSVALKATWTDGTNTFSTWKTTGALTAKTDGFDGALFTVSGAAVDTYTVKIDDITTGLGAGMTKKFPMTIKKKALATGTETTLANKNAFADYQITSSNENVVKATIDTLSTGNELKNIVITALSAGTATLTFTATDATGLVATTTTPVNVTVSANDYKIVATVINPATGADGEVVNDGSEMGMIVGANTLKLTLMKGNAVVPTLDTNWSVVDSDPKTVGTKDTDDEAAWVTVGSQNPSSNALAITPTTLGIKTLKVTYNSDADTSYVREIPVRSYYAFVFKGPKDDDEAAAYEISNNGTALKKAEVASLRIPYVNGTHGTVNTRKYQASLAGFSAKQIGTYTKAYDFKGWSVANAQIKTDGSNIKFKKNAEFDQTILEYAFPASGAYEMYAVFDEQDLRFTLPEFIELDDSKVSNPSTYGSDTTFVQFDVAPITSTNRITISSTNKDKFVMKADAKAVADDPDGYTGATNLWNGSAQALRINKGNPIDGSRVDAFSVAKITDPALSKDYVGTSEIIVEANGDEFGTIPVYLNGEFIDKMNTTTDTSDDVIRYMYRGEVLKSGSKIVKGVEHFYRDSKLVTGGPLEVEVDGTTKKILIIDSTWYKNAGVKKFNDKTYLVKEDGYLFTAGITEVSGINRLFREDGTMVNYGDSDVVDGKITVAGVAYVIATDGSASFDDILYNAKVNWTKKFDSKYTKGTGLPEIQYTISYTSKNTGKTETTEVKNAVVTCDGDYAETSTATQLTFTATASLEGYWKTADAKEAATAAPLTETYKFKNGGLEGTTGQDIGGEMMVDGLEESYYYTGQPIKPVIVVTDGDFVLAQGVDYTVTYSNNKKISSKSGDEYTPTAQVIVKGKGNYEGQAQTLYFAIIDPKDAVEEGDLDVKGFSIKLPKEDHYYTGEAHYPSSITLKKGKTEYTYQHEGDGLYTNTEGEIPAVVTFSNNVNKGSATVCVTGKDKSIKKSFQIKAAEFNGDFEVQVDESAAWAVKGAQPTVGIAWNGAELVPGQDFKVSYSKNKAIGTATAKITGKGNFKGKLEKSFSVTALPLSEEMVAAVSAVVGKKGAKVTLLDGVGNVIPTSKYTVSVLDGETDITKTTKLEAEKDYTIRIAKKTAELDGDPIDVTVQAGIDVKAAKINAKSVVKTYTGEAITLTDEDIAKIAVTYKGATLVAGTDFEITGYANNIKKGSMTVTIKGIGKYSGAKTFKVKIAPKPIKATN